MPTRVLPSLSPLLSGHQALDTLSLANFRIWWRKIQSEVEVDDRLGTSHASPVARLFQNKVMFLLKIILIYDTLPLSDQPALSSHLPVPLECPLNGGSTVSKIQLKRSSVCLRARCSLLFKLKITEVCGYFAVKCILNERRSYASDFMKNHHQRSKKTISASQGWSSERVSFFQLAFLFLFSLTIHTNLLVEVLWWENAPLQSISKRTKQSKKSR